MNESELTPLDQAYQERNRLVALLSRLYPSGIRKTEIPGWDPEWHNCVFIDTPEGQMSWHYHDREAYLFADLPEYIYEYDGHSTTEKYQLIERLCVMYDNAMASDLGWQVLPTAPINVAPAGRADAEWIGDEPR
jgi:hypothetical protein